MAGYYLRCVGGANGRRIPESGRLLKAYDPDADDGRGRVEWTSNPDDALTFLTPAAVLACWQTVSAAHPTRPDGQPNRPLTYYTITAAPADQS